MNMGHPQKKIKNEVPCIELVDAMDDLEHVKNLLMLIHMATEGQKTKEGNAIAEAIGVALGSLDVCVSRLEDLGGQRT